MFNPFRVSVINVQLIEFRTYPFTLSFHSTERQTTCPSIVLTRILPFRSVVPNDQALQILCFQAIWCLCVDGHDYTRSGWDIQELPVFDEGRRGDFVSQICFAFPSQFLVCFGSEKCVYISFHHILYEDKIVAGGDPNRFAAGVFAGIPDLFAVFSSKAVMWRNGGNQKDFPGAATGQTAAGESILLLCFSLFQIRFPVLSSE